MSQNKYEDFHQEAGLDLMEGMTNKEADETSTELGQMFAPAKTSAFQSYLKKTASDEKESSITWGGNPQPEKEKESTMKVAVPAKGSPEWHQLKIAIKTLQMNPAMAGVMGGPSPEEAKQILAKHGMEWDEAKNRPVQKKASAKTANKHMFEHDAEIVVSQVLNGGFMQLWDNYGDRPGYHVKSMIMRTAQFFRDKGAEEIAQIFDQAAKIEGKVEFRRDQWGNIPEDEYEAEWDAKSSQFDPLESKFYDMWESNYEGKPGVEDSWDKYFSPEAEKDSQLFRMMQQQKPEVQASVKAAALAKAKKAGGLTYTDADLKALLKAFYGMVVSAIEDRGLNGPIRTIQDLLPSEQEVEEMIQGALSDTPVDTHQYPADASSYLDPESER